VVIPFVSSFSAEQSRNFLCQLRRPHLLLNSPFLISFVWLRSSDGQSILHNQKNMKFSCSVLVSFMGFFYLFTVVLAGSDRSVPESDMVFSTVVSGTITQTMVLQTKTITSCSCSSSTAAGSALPSVSPGTPPSTSTSGLPIPILGASRAGHIGQSAVLRVGCSLVLLLIGLFILL